MLLTSRSELQGPERVEPFSPIGKGMRMGNIEALSLSDYEAVMTNLKKQNYQKSLKYLNLFQNDHIFSIACILEEILILIAESKKFADSNLEKLLDETYQDWSKKILLDNSNHLVEEAALIITKNWASIKISENSIKIFHSELENQIPSFVLLMTDKVFEPLLQGFELLDDEKFEAVTECLEDYFVLYQFCNDIFIQFMADYYKKFEEKFGKDNLMKLIISTKDKSRFNDDYITNAFRLNAEKLTAFIAQKFRANLSGKERRGQVNIIESEKYYQIEIESCGLAHEIRTTDHVKMNANAEWSWNLDNEVSPLCTSCSNLELEINKYNNATIIETLYNKDPNKPCGFKIVKEFSLKDFTI